MKKSDSPLVSIVMPVYNGSNYMREAIDSALAQTYDNVEVIVVNDGSTDGGKTDAIAKSYGNKIRYFVKENGGVSSALNFGIEQMRGEYFSWLSHDDMYLPEKIESEVEALKGHDKHSIVFSNFHLFDDKGKTFATTHHELRATEELVQSDIYPVLRGMVNGDTILIHKDIFKQCGKFDEKSQTAGDYKMWLKIFDRFPHIFVEQPLSKYRIHDEQDTKKSPVYNQESDAFWSETLDLITEKRVKKWGISLFQIYMDLYTQFKNDNLANSAKKVYSLGQARFEKDDIAISILMPAFNAEEYLEEAVNSVLSSEFGDFELVVVDDCSSDKTRSILENLAKKDFRIRPLFNKKNLGVAKTLNSVLASARGKYVTRMDSDDVALPNRFLRQFIELEKGKFDFCGTDINLMDENGKIYSSATYGRLYAPARFAAAFVNPIPNVTTMYRRDLIKKHRLAFSETVAAEDHAFMLNYLRIGDGTMVSEPLYNYRIRKDSSFHANKDYALEKSYELCGDYGNEICPGFSETELFKVVNGYRPYKFEFTNDLVLRLIKEGDAVIAAFAKKFAFSKDDILRCRAFLFEHIHAEINIVINGYDAPVVHRGPIGTIYHYFLDNGVKKTAKQILRRATGGH